MSDATSPSGDLDARGAADDAAPVAPSLRFVSGTPSDEEVAAVHVVMTALAAERAALGADRVTPPVDLWARAARVMRAPLTAGPGRWRESRGLRS